MTDNRCKIHLFSNCGKNCGKQNKYKEGDELVHLTGISFPGIRELIISSSYAPMTPGGKYAVGFRYLYYIYIFHYH